MKTITIKKDFSKTDERKYYFIPFNIPENIEKLVIKYSYDGDSANSRQDGSQKNCIDLGLVDNNGADVGTRGSSVREVVISPSFATPGYHNVQPAQGEWQLVIGAYQIKPTGVTVTIVIDFYEKEYRWLKGDTHLHTNNSDGKFTREQLAKKCARAKLDYMIYTDHNNDMVGAEPPIIDGMTAIKGLELTNYNAHVNFFGVAKPYSGSYAINNRADIISAINQGHANGALVSVCHPHCRFCGWKFDDLAGVPFDFLEIWNGPMRKDNIKTIDFWDSLLKQGRKVAVIGGSDFHRDYVVTNLLAMPTTRVYADCNSKDAIFAAMLAGRIVITQNPRSTMLELTVNNAPIGSNIHYEKGLKAKIVATDLKRGHILKLIDQNGVLFQFVAPKKGNYTFEIPIRGAGYIRAEVDYLKKGLAKLIYKIALLMLIKDEAFEKMPLYPYALTNAIYIDGK